MYALVKFGQMRRAAGPAGDADVAAWVAAVATNGGTVSAPRRAIVETLVTGLKADAIWSKLDRLWLLAAEDTPSALTDLKALALATTVSSPTFTVDQGYQGNGSSSYVDTNFPPNTGTNFLQDSAHIGAWDLTSRTTAATKALAGVEGASTNRIEPRTSSGSGTQFSVNAVSQATVANADAQGAYIVSRTGSTTTDVYKNGSAIITGATNASAARTNIDFYVLANNSGGTAGSFSDDQCAAFWLGGGLNSTEAGNLYTRIQTYLIAVGAITDDADVNTWVGRAKSNGGTVSKGRQTLVYNLITGLKSDGVWSKLDRLWLFAAENTGSALTDLVTGALATATNSPSFTTDRGYTGNGSSSYINTGFNPTTASSPNFVQDSACMFVWNNTSGADAGAICGYSVASGSQQTRIFPQFTNGSAFWDINDNTPNNLVYTAATGLYIVNRSASNATVFEVNNSSVDSNTNASVAPTNDVFTALVGNGGSSYSARQCSGFGFGGKLTGTERGNLYSRLRTYMTAVGVP